MAFLMDNTFKTQMISEKKLLDKATAYMFKFVNLSRQVSNVTCTAKAIRPWMIGLLSLLIPCSIPLVSVENENKTIPAAPIRSNMGPVLVVVENSKNITSFAKTNIPIAQGIDMSIVILMTRPILSLASSNAFLRMIPASVGTLEAPIALDMAIGTHISTR